MEVPQNREDAVVALLRFLRARWEQRQTEGWSPDLHVKIKTRNRSGQKMNLTWTGDVSVGNSGRQLLAAILGVWPDGVHLDEDAAALLLDVAYDFVRTGILRPKPGEPYLLITIRGAAVLAKSEEELWPLHVRRAAGLAGLEGLPSFGILVRHYEEAISAYDLGLDYSATVMIGVCYEHGLNLIGREIAAWQNRIEPNKVPGAEGNKAQGFLKALTARQYVPAKAVGDVAGRVLEQLGKELGADKEWVSTCFRPTCFFVKSLRNSAGHPTGAEIARDEVASHILLAPAFFRRVQSLLATLAAQDAP